MPLELAACGAETVTNTYLAKNEAYLRQISPHIHPGAANVDDLTRALLEALACVETSKEDCKGMRDTSRLDMPETWHQAFSPIMPELEQWTKQ